MRLATILLILTGSQEGMPPTVISVAAKGDPTAVVVVFSKPIEKISAESAANYIVEPKVKVESATRGSDLRTVTLKVSPLDEGTPYFLSLRNVKDCEPTPRSVAPEARLPFSFVKGLLGAAPKNEPKVRAIPRFKDPVPFNSPEADAILAALQVFPKNNPWNEDITRRPVHPDSDKMVSFVGKEKNLRVLHDMNFVLVPPQQPRVEVKILRYAGESDPGPYPVPSNTPIEGFPMDGRTLEQSQTSGGADRHAIVVDPHAGMAYEFFKMYRRPGGWEADGEATWDLKTNKLRTRNWTSADAAGLPIFPALPRYDEVESGNVDHALRMTVRQTRREFVHPATHHAGSSDLPQVPAMGQRFRLKASVDISGFPRHARAIAQAMKKHGLFVADNGGDWDVCVPPDSRIKGWEAIQQLKGSDFEVVVTPPGS